MNPLGARNGTWSRHHSEEEKKYSEEMKGKREGMVSKTSGYECQKSRGRGG